MNKIEIQLISSKAMLEFLDTINYESRLTRDRKVYSGQKLIAKQIKAKL